MGKRIDGESRPDRRAAEIAASDVDEVVDFGLEDSAFSPAAGIESPPPLNMPEPIELADEPPAPVGVIECPSCGVMLRRGSTMCDRCGVATLDESAGKARVQRKAERRICRRCGYDLRGLPHRRCPECGVVDPAGSKRDRVVAAEHEYRRHLRRAQVIGGTLAVILIVAFAIIGGITGGGAGFRLGAYWLLFAGVELACSVGLAAVVGHFVIDLDDPWELTVARLFAAQSIGTAVAVLGGAICAPGLILGAAAYVVAIALLFELDAIEGLFIGFAALALRIGLLIGFFLLL